MILLRDWLSSRFIFLSKLSCFLLGLTCILPIGSMPFIICLVSAFFFDFLSMKLQKENGSRGEK